MLKPTSSSLVESNWVTRDLSCSVSFCADSTWDLNGAWAYLVNHDVQPCYTWVMSDNTYWHFLRSSNAFSCFDLSNSSFFFNSSRSVFKANCCSSNALRLDLNNCSWEIKIYSPLMHLFTLGYKRPKTEASISNPEMANYIRWLHFFWSSSSACFHASASYMSSVAFSG